MNRAQYIDTLSWFNVVFACRDHCSGPHTVTLSHFQIPIKWFKFFRFKSNPKIILQNMMQIRKPNLFQIQISATVIKLSPCGDVITDCTTHRAGLGCVCATGAIAPGPPFQGGPHDYIFWKWNIRFKNCHDSKEILEYNSIFRCCVEYHLWRPGDGATCK